MQHTIFSLNKIGKRENIEDSISPVENLQYPVFVVCDGVGGNSYGEVASEIGVKVFFELLTQEYNGITNLNSFNKIIEKAVIKFTATIKDFISKNENGKSASSTLTIAVLKDNIAYIAWCGDSKIIHFSNRVIKYQTKDHSLVQELLNNGLITKSEAATHPQKNIITKSLNAKVTYADIETATINQIAENDWLLLCTDGLLEQNTDEKINEILNAYTATSNLENTIDSLCVNKTNDNYSMILVLLKNVKAKKKIAIYLTILFVLATLAILFFAKDKFAQKNTNNLPVKNTNSGRLSDTIKINNTLTQKDTNSKNSTFKTIIKK